MVTPSWGSFQKPEQPPKLQQAENRLEDEFKEEIPGGIEDAGKPEGNKPQWGDFKTPSTYQGPVDPTVEESTIGYLARNAAAVGSRIAEQVLGAAGNIEKVGRDIIASAPKSSGILGWALSELVGQERWERMVKGPNKDNQALPTSQQLKDVSQEVTGGYTKPKTKGEERFQGYVEDVASTLITRRPTSLRNMAVNNLGIPLASNYVKNTVQDLGFGEDKATIAKLGTWTALSLLGNVNAPQYASDLMNQGRNGMPTNVNIDVSRLQQRLQAVANSPNLLHADPRSALARREIAAIQQDLANGQVSTRSMMTTYDGINAAKRDASLFTLNRGDRRFAARAVDQVRDAVREEIMQSGAAHPQALQNWQSGVQAWAVIHQSNAMTNWISSVAKGPYAKAITGPAAAVFGVGAYGAATHPLIGLPGAAGATALHKATQTAYRVWNDPNLSNYYWRAVSAAQAENAPAFINNYNKINKELTILQKKDKSKKDANVKK